MYSTFPAISGDGDRDDDRDEDLLIVKEKCYPLKHTTRWTVLYFLASFNLGIGKYKAVKNKLFFSELRVCSQNLII